jgi:serine/threonine protein phosphatase PrpC
MAAPISPTPPKWENPYWDERGINDKTESPVEKQLPDTIFSRNGLSAADKMDKQLSHALIDPNGKQKNVDEPFEVEVSQDGHPLEYAPFSSACTQRRGKRDEQEDEFLLPVEVSFTCKGTIMKGLLFGVFDGHGDAQKMGRLLKDKLAAKLSEILQDSCANIDSVSEEIIGNAFTQTFHEFSREYQGKYRRGGATASCAFIFENVVYCPNVGDSRMLLVTPEASYQVSEDAYLGCPPAGMNARFANWHKKKGKQIFDMGIYGFRLYAGGLLNMGRDVGSRGVCDRPKIPRFFLGKGPDGKLCCERGQGFLVLSSDGLSDAALVEEVGREVRKLVAGGASLQQMTDALATKAASYPDSDNVTVMIVKI